MGDLLAVSIVCLTIFFLVSWLFISLAVYFIPIIVAYIRGHKDIVPIIILNIVLGWTFLGWLAALLWALNQDTNSTKVDS